VIDLNDKTRAQIVKSVVAAVCVSPDKLTKKAYDWLNKRGGFIAHYDHAGFASHYTSGEETLRDALLMSAETCYSLHVNIGPSDKFYEYRVWSAETMRQILSTLGIWPHGREPVVTGVVVQPEPKCTEEEVIALLEAE